MTMPIPSSASRLLPGAPHAACRPERPVSPLPAGPAGPRHVRPGERRGVRHSARLVLAVLLCQVGLLPLPAHAQIASASAPSGQRAIMDAAQNGVPIAHIAPPSAAGVSRNQYSQFNVAPSGLILNNSAQPVATVQGGWISGNAQLGPTPARIILNEVVGASASQLRGTIEVAGQRASVVVANPNGIVCDGCGFLNTGRATLTTGQPQFGPHGSLQGFDVRQGQLTVSRGGLSAGNIEQLDLLARGIVLEGEVWAQHLHVLAGANQVLHDTLQTVAQGGSGPAPRFAVDIKDLGGMYASQIYLVSTELGLGVNSTGRMAALQGNLVLAANGDLTLKDSYAQQNIRIDGASIALTGQTTSERATTIAATGALTNQGTIDSQEALTLHAASIANSGTLTQRSAHGAVLAATGDLVNTGSIYSGGQASVTAAAVSNRSSRISGSQGVAIAASSLDNTEGNISAAETIALTIGGAIDNTRGKIVSDRDLSLTAATLSNQYGTVGARQAASLQLGQGLLDNTQGQVIGTQSLALDSGEIRNSAGLIASGAALSLDTGGATLTNTHGGQIVAQGDLVIASAGFDNSTGTTASITGQLQVATGGHALHNDGGKLQAAGNTILAAGNTSSQGGLISGHDVTATTGALDNDSGQIIAAGALSLSTLALSSHRGLLQSVGNMHIHTNGQALVNTGSGNAAGIVSGGTLAVTAGSVSNQGGFVASNGEQTWAVAGDLDNRAGQIVTNAGSTIAAANVFNQTGRIHALGDLGIATGQLDNRAGALAATGKLMLAATTVDNRLDHGVAGTIDAASIRATLTSLDNRGGALRAGADATVSSTSLDNTGGTLSAGGNLSLSSTGMHNINGRMVGNQAVTIATSSQSLGGTIASGNDVTLTIAGDYINTSVLSAQNDLTLTAASLHNSGTMKAGQTLTAHTGHLTNSGEISGQSVLLNVSGTLTNTATGLIDGTHTRVNAGTLSNTGRLYGDWLRIHADTVSNSGTGVIAARDTLLIGAQTLNNTDGALIYSLGTVGIGGSIDGNGQLQGAMHSLTNASARIEATGDMAIAAATILNRNDGLSTARVVDAPVYTERVQPNGSATQYPVTQCSGVGGSQDSVGCIVHPDKYGQRSPIAPVFAQVCQSDTEFNTVCTTQPGYAWNDPVFARFGVATVGSPAPAEPSGGCSGTDPAGGSMTVSSPACDQWRSARAVWDSAYQTTLAQLDVPVSAYNAGVNEDNRIDRFEDYTWYKVDSTTSHTVVATSAPAQLLAGGNLSLAGAVTNQDSQIVAGATLAISGPAVRNIATQGEERAEYSGTTQFTEVHSCGTFGGDHCRGWQAVNPYNPAPTILTTDLPTLRYEQSVGNQTSIRTLAQGTGSIDTSVAPAIAAASGNSRTATGQAVGTTLGHNVLASLAVPRNSLFVIHAEPAANTLIETDPRFTSYRSFVGSDYFLQALNRDPQRELKRYGDAFVEQRLVSDQILALTGRRYLDGYSNTEDEYKALMDAGVAFARQYRISPGVVLSGEQMALLTTDIVWLTQRTVTLADGTTQEVLVPQVFLRRPAEGDLQANGTLMSGRDVLIQSSGDLVNSGAVTGDTVTALAGNDLVQQGGRIGGQDLFLRAGNDLKNLSGVIAGGSTGSVSLLAGRDIVLQTQTLGSASADGTSSRTSVQRIATVQGGDIRLDAGRDLVVSGATVTAGGDLIATAGRDLVAGTVASDYRLDVLDGSGATTQGRTGHLREAASLHQSSVLSAGGNMALVADGDVRLRGVQAAAGIDSGSGTGTSGSLLVQGQSVVIEAVKNRVATDLQTIGPNSYTRVARDDETLVAGSLTAAAHLSVEATGVPAAGKGHITLAGAHLSAGTGQAALVASGDITLQNDSTRHVAIDERYSKSGNLVGSVASTSAQRSVQQEAEGSSVSGNTVIALAGRDLTVRGSAIVGDGDVALAAARTLTLEAAKDTREETRFHEEKRSGLMSSGGAGFTIGVREQSTDLSSRSTASRASTVGSLGGNVSLSAGEAYRQVGSDVLAPQGNIVIDAQSVAIVEAQESSDSSSESRFRQSGLTVAVSNAVISGVQTVQQMAQAAGQTSDPRMQALAAANVALAASRTRDTLLAGQGTTINGEPGRIATGVDDAGNPTSRAATDADRLGGIDVSLSVGSSNSRSSSTQSSTRAAGSTVAAGGQVIIRATGAGAASTINVHGSTITAGTDVRLKADGAIVLQAAANSAQQRSSSDHSSASLGVSAGTSGLRVTASGSKGRGNADGSDQHWTNSHIEAGERVVIESGGDTILRGAVAEGRQVVTDIRGNLVIESLQDTSTYASRSSSIGGSLSVGSTVSGSLNISNTKIDSTFASVAEQSALRAGDGGFQVAVQGTTRLIGGAITSTDAALRQGANDFDGKGGLIIADIDNRASYSGESVGLNLGSGIDLVGKLAPGSTSMGVGSDSGDAASVTRGAISGIAGDQAARTGDREAGIANPFEAGRVERELNAQVAITQRFGQESPRVAAAYSDLQARSLRAQAEAAGQAGDADSARALTAEAAQWDESGARRAALHGAVGALAGGLAGAVGAAAVAGAAPLMEQLQEGVTAALRESGASEAVAQAAGQLVAQGVATGMGMALTGGNAAGGAMALNVEANNRQLHIATYNRLRDGCRGSSSTECQTINRMAGVRSGMPTDDPSIAASKVVANYDSNNHVVSYTLVDRVTHQPTMIMEPLEYAAYRNASAGDQALMQLSPQYALDFASAGLYAAAGNNGRAIEHMVAGVTSRDYARDVALGVVGAVGAAVTATRPGVVANPGAKGAGELSFGANGRKLDFLFNRNIDQSNVYNTLRAEGNAGRIGIADTPANRTEVARLFNEAYNNPATIIGTGKLPGSNVREFFLPGVTRTGSKIQFVEQSGKIITIMAK